MSHSIPRVSDEAWNRAQRESDFWDERFHDFMERYPNLFLAADPHTEEIIATAPDLSALWDEVSRMGYDARRVWTIFQPGAPRVVIL